MKRKARKRSKLPCQPRATDEVQSNATSPTCSKTSDHGAAHGQLEGQKQGEVKIRQAEFHVSTEESHVLLRSKFEHPDFQHFINAVRTTGKQTHLGWLSIIMASELRRKTPREGEHAFPCYLHELYGMILKSVAEGINQKLGSELVLAMIMLLFFEIELHGCPEPAAQHLRGLETIISARITYPDKPLEIERQLDRFAAEVVQLTRSAITIRRDFHPQCPDHPESSLTWNVCVNARLQLVQLRDYVASVLEVLKIEAFH